MAGKAQRGACQVCRRQGKSEDRSHDAKDHCQFQHNSSVACLEMGHAAKDHYAQCATCGTWVPFGGLQQAKRARDEGPQFSCGSKERHDRIREFFTRPIREHGDTVKPRYDEKPWVKARV